MVAKIVSNIPRSPVKSSKAPVVLAEKSNGRRGTTLPRFLRSRDGNSRSSDGSVPEDYSFSSSLKSKLNFSFNASFNASWSSLGDRSSAVLPTAPPSPSPSTLERKVRFRVDSRDRIRSKVHKYDVPDDLDKSKVYYRKDEMQQMKRSALLEASDLANEDPALVDSVERLLDSPLKFKGSRGEHLTPDEALQVVRDRSDEARGLELRVSTLLPRHQRWAISCVLRCQSHLQHDGGPEAIDQADAILRSRCEQVNQGPRDFALRMARGDELEARQIYGEA